MSKGPGKWQRAILEALEKQDKVFVHDMMPRWIRADHSDYKAFRHAIGTLEQAGKIVKGNGWKDDKPGFINDGGILAKE